MKSSASSGSIARMNAGATAWAAAEKVNAELFTLTYGALVRQLMNDSEECVEDVNAQLDKLGYNIGMRLVDEYFAKTGAGRCLDFRDAADAVAKVALKMFLGVTAQVVGWNAEGTSCSLILEDNPFADFVELPEEHSGLSYCNLLCGVIRGALEQVSWRVTCVWTRDPLVPGGIPAAALAAASGSGAGGSGAGGGGGAAAPAALGAGEGGGAWEMRLTMVEQLPEHYPFNDE